MMMRMEGDGPYTEAVAAIDEAICRLVAERQQAAGGRRVYPDNERLRRWSDQFGIGETRLLSLFGNLAAGPRLNPLPPMPQGLRRVVELMRPQESQGVSWVLTHGVQYENASLLHIEMMSEKGRVIRHGGLALEVDQPGYQSHDFGGHGSQGHFAFDFIVWPALPDDLSGIAFTLRQSDEEASQQEPLRLDMPIAFSPQPGS